MLALYWDLLALELLSPAGVVAEALDGGGHVNGLGDREGLACEVIRT